MATENAPFSHLLTDTEKGLRREGYEFQQVDNLSDSQQDAIRQEIESAQQRDVLNQVIDLTRATNETNAILGGIYSDTIQFDRDEQTGATKMDVKPEFQAGAETGDADLPAITWDDRHKALVVEIVDEGEQTVQWAVGYMRSTAPTVE